ncbi:hypothetical protein WJX84_006092 [Apatococcus fuscideae]|uniref:Uncharacterized protein n=1 Tax=Apatococcus fuscideae TaxID=2026836 RepID=A0AAW1TA15_9CHLO
MQNNWTTPDFLSRRDFAEVLLLFLSLEAAAVWPVHHHDTSAHAVNQGAEQSGTLPYPKDGLALSKALCWNDDQQLAFHCSCLAETKARDRIGSQTQLIW